MRPQVTRDMLREDGKLPAYQWPGGYPIFYLDGRDNTLCPKCATESLLEDDPIDPKDAPVADDANWEDPFLFCDQCSERIPSAYAEDEFEEAQELKEALVLDWCMNFPQRG